LYKDIAEDLKEAHDEGLNVCLGFIPYRGDDITKYDSDITGRVSTIKISHWDEDSLIEIPNKGFSEEKLNLKVSEKVIDLFANEAVGSPHLMQKLCYNLCYYSNVKDGDHNKSNIEFDVDKINTVMNEVAIDLEVSYDTAVHILDGSKRGTSEKEFEFIDGKKGDRYTALLRGLIAKQPQTVISLDELKERIKDHCRYESPASGNITQDVQRLDDWISETESTDDFLFDFNEDKGKLVVPEPQLIFYLRWSGELDFKPSLD
jgi:hypothetical protein